MNKLITAIKKGCIVSAVSLAKSGKDLNAKDEYGWTALMLACENTHFSAISIALIKAGADVNVKSRFSCTPLMIAATQGNSWVVEALIKAGADVHTLDRKGRTALMLIKNKANKYGNYWKIKRLLKDAGATE